MRHGHRGAGRRGASAGIRRLIRQRVHTTVAGAGAFRAQPDGDVVHDHDVVRRVAIAQAVVRLIRGHRHQGHQTHVGRRVSRGGDGLVLVVRRPERVGRNADTQGRRLAQADQHRVVIGGAIGIGRV